MAKIYAMPNQKEWDKVRDWKSKTMTYEEQRALEEKLYAQIPQDKIISFGVADGSAQYYVQSLKPLVICHIPYCDAYRAHYLIEKALTVAEVKKMLGHAKAFKKLFNAAEVKKSCSMRVGGK